MHATRNGKPIEDSKQNVELISGYEKDGQTSVTFKRKHVTCDGDHDMIIGVSFFLLTLGVEAVAEPMWWFGSSHTLYLSLLRRYLGYTKHTCINRFHSSSL